MRRVILPLLRPALVAALVYSFVRAMTAVSAVIFLVTARMEISATTYIVGRVEAGEFGLAIAYSSVLIVVMLFRDPADPAHGRRTQAWPPHGRRPEQCRDPGCGVTPMARQSSRASVEFRAVVKQYGAVRAVNDINFTIEPGRW